MEEDPTVNIQVLCLRVLRHLVQCDDDSFTAYTAEFPLTRGERGGAGYLSLGNNQLPRSGGTIDSPGHTLDALSGTGGTSTTVRSGRAKTVTYRKSVSQSVASSGDGSWNAEEGGMYSEEIERGG